MDHMYIINPKFELVGVIDSYTSLIWTERYNDCGDFEIMISANDKNIDILQNGYYIKRTDTDRVGIAETKTTQTNEETGDYIIVWEGVWKVSLIGVLFGSKPL